ALAAGAGVAARRAAEHARTLGSTSAASSLWSRTVELWPEDDPEYPAVVLALETTAFNRGESLRDVPGAIANLRRAVDLFLAAGGTERAAEAEIACGHLAWWAGLGEQADGYLARAVELVRDLPDSESKAVVLTERARRLMLRANHEEGRPAMAETLAIIERLGLV